MVLRPIRTALRGLGLTTRGARDVSAKTTREGAVVGEVAGSDPDPVVLVHGYLDTDGTPWWDVLTRYLTEAGWPADRVHRVNVGDVPGTTVGSPRVYAEEVQAELERVHDVHDAPADVLCHSMGGLATRWCVEQGDGADLVDDVVTLGTPHQGTVAAYLGALTPGGRDMLPESTFVGVLTEDGLEPSVRYTAVWSSGDGLVVPSENATIPDDLAHEDTLNVNSGSQGHVEMIHDPDVFATYVDRLG